MVRDLVPDKDKYAYIIDQLEKQHKLDQKSKFKGAPHCEAILATLHYLAKNPHEASSVYPPPHTLRPQDILYSCVWLMFLSVRGSEVLKRFGGCAALVAPSKRSCPVCAVIVRALSKMAKKDRDLPRCWQAFQDHRLCSASWAACDSEADCHQTLWGYLDDIPWRCGY